MTTRSPAVGILANPRAGSDVRRLAARAGSSTLEGKRSQVTRAAVGACAAGVRRIVIVREPLRVAVGALESLAIDIDVEVVDIGARLDAKDTERAAEAMRAAGCGALVVLGGDGTNRALARAWPEACVVPVSTGTNNVFPRMLEPTIAGAAAGLIASGRLPTEDLARPVKQVRVALPDGSQDLALVDVGLLADDAVGNLMPVEPAKIRSVVLARAEPASVGLSPIGGLLEPAGEKDDFGVLVACTAHADGGRPLLVPVSPGLYRTVHVASARRVALGEEIVLRGPGVLAFDGDRDHALRAGEHAVARVVRGGPRVIDVERTLAAAAASGLYLDRGPFRDGHGLLPDCC
ncbi:MAG: ATP-NAD kinase [Deltaproteobacteria bacterium]|nr:ATP-NAD kinase [Deltaproteobacteria bacterium]